MALILTTMNARTGTTRRSRKIRAEDARRAAVILMLADGASFTAITCGVGVLPGLHQSLETAIRARTPRRPAGEILWAAPTLRTPAMEARILAKTRQAPPDGSTHWSTRKLAKVMGVSHGLIAQVWRRAGLQPHRLERYMLSDDPDFEQKAADVLGLYLNPPEHAVVFAADEKTAIQALDRLDPVLPLSPGRAERHGFEYYRHGTLSLYAALNTKTGEIVGQTVPRHTSEAFIEFLQDIVDTQPRGERSTSSSTISPRTRRNPSTAFLEDHPRVHLHFTPTYSSGSTRSNSGSRRSSAIYSRAASSRRFLIWRARSGATSSATTNTRNRFAGPTTRRHIASLLIQQIQPLVTKSQHRRWSRSLHLLSAS